MVFFVLFSFGLLLHLLSWILTPREASKSLPQGRQAACCLTNALPLFLRATPAFGRFPHLLGKGVVECCFAVSQHSYSPRNDAVVIRFSADRYPESKGPASFLHWIEGELLCKLVVRIGQHSLDGVDASVLDELSHCADTSRARLFR
jgi:hypothetical protein